MTIEDLKRAMQDQFGPVPDKEFQRELHYGTFWLHLDDNAERVRILTAIPDPRDHDIIIPVAEFRTEYVEEDSIVAVLYFLIQDQVTL